MTTTGEDMPRDMPTYTDENQGVDQDRDGRASATVERAERRARNRADKSSLIARLNNPESSLAGMAAALSGKTAGRDAVRAAGHIPRVVIYLRVSTEEQAKMGGEVEGYSIPYQREQCSRGQSRELVDIYRCWRVGEVSQPAGVAADAARPEPGIDL
jgi:hypothetical protein